MSRILVQPVGQKRLTNVAVVRLKKHGTRFEIACYKNKVLSWRSGVEKDLDEVLQSQTVYSNVSKGILSKSKDLLAAFGTDDQGKICLEILDKGDLQVAGKERESQLSSQFRDIATIVMQKTFNPETQRPYTISMIERLMHEIHFAVDPHGSSKKQALEVIHELQKLFPIKRSPMRLRLYVPEKNYSSLLEKLNIWNATIVSKDDFGSQPSIVCEIDPGLYRDSSEFVSNLQGRFEVLAHSVHVEGDDTHVDDYDDYDNMPSGSKESAKYTSELSEKFRKQTTVSVESGNAKGEGKQNKCSTCNAFFGDSKEFRDHFKGEWHKHNVKRKTRQLPPLTEEECMVDPEVGDSRADLKEYSF
ncbi:ribosome maturation protein SBDS [Juglans microcarpa x Juglans regia]|uniref:ribosome maturation protein SBDS n=1 Tax=Juglans microcarpa x Juglans regia TaxID=2249226 RepID=UPI001B7DBABC|nr:ribosome maturation protein SBDS [Juglans microcarpa x Juglans regia]